MAHPTLIDRYEIKKTLGAGASGAVYLAWDPKLLRDVAVKVLRNDGNTNEKARERFIREARAVASLRHPNVVEIYDYSGEDSKHLYIVMEYLEGSDLFNLMAQYGAMSEAAAASIAHELCLALAAAHDQGVIHRDLKPENVFLTPAGRVVLTDFGIVKAVKEDSAVGGWGQKTDVIGTPGFMPPEVMMNSALGTYTDIFALGVLLYNVATGQLPYEGTGPVDMFKSMMSGNYPDPRDYNTYLSQGLCDLLAGMIEPKVKKRMHNVVNVRDQLRVILGECGVADLREDLREYMQDPRGYWESSRDCAVMKVVQDIKIATKDRDMERIALLRKRLTQLDPTNEEVLKITGVIQMTGGFGQDPYDSVANERPGVFKKTRQSTLGGFQWAAAALVALALAGAGGMFWKYSLNKNLNDKPTALLNDSQKIVGGDLSKTSNIANADTLQKNKTAANEDASCRLKLRAMGSGGVILLDGQKVGRLRRSRTIEVLPGEHTLEIRTRKRKARARIETQAGANYDIQVFLKEGRIGVTETLPN